MEEQNVLYRSFKVRLKPTPEQEVLFMKSAGTARWAYNYYLAENERIYEEYLNGTSKTKSISQGALRKHINNVLKPTTHQWLGEVSNNVMKQAVKDADLARKRWFDKVSDKPRFKSKHKSKLSFYVDYYNLKRMPHGFKGERLGYVKTTKPLPKLKKGEKYSNPRISFDGKYWSVSVGYKIPKKNHVLTGESIGIDVGVKDLAICSNGNVYKNINKTARVRKLTKRLRREQRKLSRKQEANIKGYTSNRKPIYKKPLAECKNWVKQVDVVKQIHKQLTDIRDNHLHQASSEIVKAKPSRIVMEDLNVKGMMKNRHLSKAIANQKLYEFKRQIMYKCENYGIEFVEADRWFPSSKICSNCGFKKLTLSLSERTYCCENCESVIDRDLNASLNLANYSI